MSRLLTILLLYLFGTTSSSAQITPSVEYVPYWKLDTLKNYDSVTAVSLRGAGENKLPNALFRCINLKYLDLSRNPGLYFDSVFIKLKLFKHLIYLNISQNRLDTLPASLFELGQLEWLCLADNGLTTIPRQITKLRNLTSLDIGNFKSPHLMPLVKRNAYEEVPKPVLKLKRLRVLMACFVGLKSISTKIYRLKHLKALYIRDNHIPIDEIDELRGRIKGVVAD